MKPIQTGDMAIDLHRSLKRQMRTSSNFFHLYYVLGLYFKHFSIGRNSVILIRRHFHFLPKPLCPTLVREGMVFEKLKRLSKSLNCAPLYVVQNFSFQNSDRKYIILTFLVIVAHFLLDLSWQSRSY